MTSKEKTLLDLQLNVRQQTSASAQHVCTALAMLLGWGEEDGRLAYITLYSQRTQNLYP